MHDGAPVPAAQIGSAVGMGHQQALIYLHMAADEARGKPVRTRNGEVPRGRPTVERRPAIFVALPLIDSNCNECGECLEVNKCFERTIHAHQNNGNAMHAQNALPSSHVEQIFQWYRDYKDVEDAVRCVPLVKSGLLGCEQV